MFKDIKKLLFRKLAISNVFQTNGCFIIQMIKLAFGSCFFKKVFTKPQMDYLKSKQINKADFYFTI
jgi:hypothetical protein